MRRLIHVMAQGIVQAMLAALLLTGAPSHAQTAPHPVTSNGDRAATNKVHSDTESFADLGSVEILHGDVAGNDLLLLLDDSDADAHQLARQLAQQGHWVAYIQSQHLSDNALEHRDACLDATTLLDVFSQHVQEKYRFAHYQKPILIGNNRAAALAYATLAQAPQRLFSAGIGIDFCPAFNQPVPPCRGDGTLRWDKHAASSFELQPDPQLNSPWLQLSTQPANCPARTRFGTDAVVPSAGLAGAIDALVAQLPRAAAPNNAAKGSAANGNNNQSHAVDDLPLVELPAPEDKGDLLVVLLSGDGGWADIDKDIGSALNEQGLPVVGWNSLQYFWNRKTPEIASADLQRVMQHYRQTWHKNRVLLIGFSLGADVLPFMISRLPAAERAQIADIALLSLSHSVDFEFHVSSWLGSSKGDTHQIAPELKKISEPVLCVYGREDDDTLCKDFKAANVANTALPGDHHYEGDFQSVAKLILAHLRNTSAAHGDTQH